MLEETTGQEFHGKKPVPQPIVARFTPWLYSSVETLLPAFFETLAGSIGGLTQVDEGKRKTWRAALKAMGEIVAPAVKLGAFIVAGKGASDLVGLAADALQGTAKGAAEALDGGEATFRQKKAQAAEVLRSLGQYGAPLRLVVLVDDLDRAAGADEVFAMLKLVKLVADLPNVSYVLAMDRKRVRDVLRKNVSQAYGDDFLDKIVQIPITLPPLSSERLSRLLIDEAQTLAKAAGLDVSTLEVNWSKWRILRLDSYEARLRPALRTLRDVARVANVFRFSALTGEAQPQLHAVDLLLLSTLQAMFPTVYDRVRQNAEFLLHEDDDWSSVFSSGSDREAEKQTRREARLREIAGAGDSAEDARSNDASPALAILKYLFPHAMGNRLSGVDRQRARNDLRIHAPERFDGYFLLQPPMNEVPRQEAMALYDALIAADPSDVDGDTGAALVVRRMTATPEPARESLIRQMDDRAAAMTMDEARALTSRLAPLVRASSGLAAGAAQGLSAHALRTLSTYRYDDREGQDADLDRATTMLVDLVNALPAFDGAEYAFELGNSETLTGALGTSRRRQIADTGLRRSAELFAATPNVFAGLASIGPRAGAEAVWAWRFLADRAGAAPADAPYVELQRYLERLLEREPAALSDILSLAAGWSDSAPGFQLRPLHELLEFFRKTLDVELLERRAREMHANGAGAVGRWPYLVEEFVRLLDAAAATTSAPAEERAAASDPAPDDESR